MKSFDKLPDFIWMYAQSNTDGTNLLSLYTVNTLSRYNNGAYLSWCNPKLLPNTYISECGFGYWDYSGYTFLYAKRVSNTLYWYAQNPNSPSNNISEYQYNGSGVKYYYFAFFL